MAAEPYVNLWVNGKHKREHQLVAEKALGKELPNGAVVHHIDENKKNNINSNLVICQDEKYHRLLHRRAAALKAVGNANAIRCGICGGWGLLGIQGMRVRNTRPEAWHVMCYNNKRRQYKYENGITKELRSIRGPYK